MDKGTGQKTKANSTELMAPLRDIVLLDASLISVLCGEGGAMSFLTASCPRILLACIGTNTLLQLGERRLQQGL